LRLENIYELGRAVPLRFSLESVDEKLRFILFPYSAKDVVLTSFALFFLLSGFAYVFSYFSTFLTYAFLYFALLALVVSYTYPVHIKYFQSIRDYNEEMLKAILRLSVFVSLDTSLEAAFFETADKLRGILGRQFKIIVKKLKTKEKTTLGEALEEFVPVWNEVNPVFVKSLRLLQTASLSPKNEREKILEETTETLLVNYTTLGKRFSEELTNNAKKLITIGVLFPILSLMLLPILSIFMPYLVEPTLLAFIYTVLFPTLTLLMALNFSAKRIQIDTIHIEDSEHYTPTPKWVYLVSGGVMLIFSIPTVLYVNYVLKNNVTVLDSFTAMVIGWVMSFGVFLGLMLFTSIYAHRYKKLWTDVREVEQDLPHLLQSFSTYLTLNMSVENIIPAVVDDYERFGFGNHPVVKAFKKLNHLLLTTKENIFELVKKRLKKILPSKKVTEVITQIVSFSEISEESSARVAKMIRKQTLSLYKLDDYIKTLLADSVGLINITTLMMAPLLTASAVVMSVGIVKSLVFIGQQLEVLAKIFGFSEGFSLNIVNIQTIVPPVLIEVIVGFYLLETILVLSLFATNINIGNDKYQLARSVKENLSGFYIYTLILFGGYFFIVKVMFQGLLGT